jgi:glycosyltransferase involved in cell wall biosynthesis
MVDGPTRLSIVVEWANTDRAGVDLSATMLREVARQIANLADANPGLARPVEILVVQTDGTTTAPPVVDALAREHDEATGRAVVEYQVLTAPPTGYYGLKNHGFAHSRGDIVVFIDSDVIPESGWLSSLLAPLADGSTQVVAGHAYIAPGGIYHKAFALFWFFPLRFERVVRPSAAALFGNNLAFRRETFARFPFVTDDATSRGACLDLIGRLTGAGIAIHRAHEARVAHPPPNGLAHFTARALAQGRDRFLRAQAGTGAEARVAASLARAAGHIARSLARIATRRREVNLSALEAPVAAGVAVSYYSLYLVGEMLTRVSPDFMIRRFRI